MPEDNAWESDGSAVLPAFLWPPSLLCQISSSGRVYSGRWRQPLTSVCHFSSLGAKYSRGSVMNDCYFKWNTEVYMLFSTFIGRENEWRAGWFFRAGHGQSVCFSLWLYHYCNGHWINQSTCVFKRSLNSPKPSSPPTVWSQFALQSPCPDLPCSEVCLPCWARGCLAPIPWGLLPGQGNHFRFSSMPGSAFTELSVPGASVSVSAQPETSHEVWEGSREQQSQSSPRARAAPGPEQLEPKPGDPAVLCSSVCVFWVTVFNFTTHSIQNSWEILLEIQNSLGVFISSSFS